MAQSTVGLTKELQVRKYLATARTKTEILMVYFVQVSTAGSIPKYRPVCEGRTGPSI